MIVPAHTFDHIGNSIANRHYDRGSKTIRQAKFKAHFGCTTKRFAQLWHLIQSSSTPGAWSWLDRGQPKHLLWGLLWLKLYNSDAVLAGMCKCDEEKTFRMWSRRAVMAMVALKEVLVRKRQSNRTKPNPTERKLTRRLPLGR